MTHPDLFYQPPLGETSGLPHDPIKSFVIPRPIGWISTTSPSGQDNLAPFSQFTNVSFDPPTILFVAHQSLYKHRQRDTVRNAIATNEFVWNMATYEQRGDVNLTGLETWGDEFDESGIEKEASVLVRPPRVKNSPVSFECRVHSILRVANEHYGKDAAGAHFVGNSDIVVGRVLGIHVKGEYIDGEGLFDVLKAMPLARNGYRQYTMIQSVFDIEPVMMPDDTVSAFVLGGNMAEVDGKVGEKEEKVEEKGKEVKG